jgi:hypothetical protein
MVTGRTQYNRKPQMANEEARGQYVRRSRMIRGHWRYTTKPGFTCSHKINTDKT